MGFNYHGYGNIRKCAIHYGRLITVDPFGRERSYVTGFPENIEYQCNLFWNTDISFLLYTEDGREVIGRPDGSISVYRENLLVGLNNWNPDYGFEVEHVGYAICNTLQRIMLDAKDRQTLFVEGVRYEALLPKKLYGVFDTSAALASIERRECDSAILLSGGEMLEIPVWSVQDSLRIGACRSIV